MERNDVRRLISKGSIFEDICRCLHVHRPSHVKVDDIDNLCVNFRRLGGIMHSVCSALYSKRDAINEEKIASLKYDLDLVMMKWHEMRFIFTHQFHVLHEHVPDLLL